MGWQGGRRSTIIASPPEFKLKALLFKYHTKPTCCWDIPKISSSCLYDKFISSKSYETVEAPSKDQLNCDIHPFFMDCLDISKEFKTFFNKVFAVAGNISENRAVSRAPFNRVILEETLSTVLS